MAIRWCSKCTARKQSEWIYCPYCGESQHYEKTPKAEQVAAGANQESPSPRLHPALDNAFCLIRDELGLQTSKANRLEKEVQGARERIALLETDLSNARRIRPFSVGNVIGVGKDPLGQADYLLQIERIENDYDHNLAHIRVRLP